MAEPPEPPSPPSTVPLREFCATPVRPEVADPVVRAPELAVLVAWPNAVAPPVPPELPESPEVAVPPRAEALPRVALFTAVMPTAAAPVGPVGPESPEVATGSAVAVEVAGPVLPLLVAEA